MSAKVYVDGISAAAVFICFWLSPEIPSQRVEGYQQDLQGRLQFQVVKK